MEMIKYIIYTQKNCIYCAEAKSLLDEVDRDWETVSSLQLFKL